LNLTGRHSITGRLTLLFVMASSVVLLALGFVIASSVEKHFEEQDMEILAGKMELARHALAKVSSRTELDGFARQLDDSLVGHHGLEMIVFGPAHDVLFATAGADFPHDILAPINEPGPLRPIVWTQGRFSYRGISAQLPTGTSEVPTVLVAVATDIGHHQTFMSAFRKTLWLFVAGAAALSGLLGWVAARRGLAPLRAMREQAAAVNAQRLDRRLPVEAVPAELAELAQTLNEMLNRLEDAFHRLSDFSSDIAHELRTPVSNLMTETQVALSRARTADEYRRVLESNAEEFERMTRMISDMLFLAKAENGLAVPNVEIVDLATQVRELFDYYDAVAEEKHLQLSLEGEGKVAGDRLMLRRALGNLLSNAVRHSPPQGSIRVHITSTQEAVSVTIENSGDAIPAEHLERVFDRFFRGDPARQRGEGAGLGLAITRSIVQAHRGTIAASSGGGVTAFTMALPADTR
jgi:two-component system heavy metal sensor histidine kinase CusS